MHRTKSVIDISVNEDCHRSDEEFYDKADILTVNISLRDEGHTIDYDPAVLVALLYSCPDDDTAMPSGHRTGVAGRISWRTRVSPPTAWISAV